MKLVHAGGKVWYHRSLFALLHKETNLRQLEHKRPCSRPPWLWEPSSAPWPRCRWRRRSGSQSVSPVLRQRTRPRKTWARRRHLLCLVWCHFSVFSSSRWDRRDTRVTRTSPLRKLTNPPQNITKQTNKKKTGLGKVWESSARQTKGSRVGFASWRKTLPSQVQTAVSCVTDQGRLTCPPPWYGNTKVKHAPCLPTVKPYPQGGQGDKAHFTWHR